MVPEIVSNTNNELQIVELRIWPKVRRSISEGDSFLNFYTT